MLKAGSFLRFVLSLAVALLVLLAFRTLVLGLYEVPGQGLEPQLMQGDRVLVNRWSYGLRTGGNGSLFAYGRLCRQQVGRSELVAYEDSLDQVLIGRCKAGPGDTVRTARGLTIVPGLLNCAKHDYYLLETIGAEAGQKCLVAEEQIIGRVCLILFNHRVGAPVWSGYPANRLLLPL